MKKKHIALVITLTVAAALVLIAFYKPGIYRSIAAKIRPETQLCINGGTATTKAALHLRSATGIISDIICTMPKGSAVTVIDDSNDEWTKVKTSDGKVGWCSRRYLAVSQKSQSSAAPSSSQAAKKSAEAAGEPETKQVSLEESSKPLHIEVSLSEQTVSVLDAQDRAVETFKCSSGKEGSETPTGTFTVSQRGESFFNDKVGEGAYYWVRFYKTYLFHSVPFDKNGTLEPDEAAKLGEPASHGCIRTSMENSKWIYDNIPEGTKVTIK